MKVVLVAECEHCCDSAGRVHTLAPVAAQLDRWAELFEEFIICTPVLDGKPPAAWAPYESSNLTLRPLPAGGGQSVASKVRLLPLLPVWVVRIAQAVRSADAVHLRAPCNIALVGMVVCLFTRKPRYAIYAGVWHGYAGEPLSYRFQRWWLRQRWFGGPVTVYSSDEHLPGHVVSFFSPSFSKKDWEREASAADVKITNLGFESVGSEARPLRVVTIGRLTDNKNQASVIRAIGRLRRHGVHARLEVIGDGPARKDLERLIDELGVSDCVNLAGSVSRSDVWNELRRADVNVLATRQEGFGKVLLEGMVTATTPVCSETGVTADIIGPGQRGITFPADDDEALASAISNLMDDPTRWQAMARAGRAYTATMTLEAFKDQIADLLVRHWDVTIERLRGSSAPAEGVPRSAPRPTNSHAPRHPT